MNSLIESISPANFPVQAGSLVDAEPARGQAKLHDKVARRELLPSDPDADISMLHLDERKGKGGLVTSQSGKTNMQVAGRRTSVSIVKVNPTRIAGRVGAIRSGERLFDSQSPQATGKARRALNMARERLEGLGLILNAQKTCLTHVRDGFEFMGFRYVESYSPHWRRLVRIKFPRPKAMKKIRAAVKARIKKWPLGRPLQEVIRNVNRLLRGWAQYFSIGNSYKAGLALSSDVCDQLRRYWRRSHPRHRGHCTRVWPNSFFYNLGLTYIPSLLRRMKNAPM